MKKSNDLENIPELSVSYRLRVIQGLLKIRSVAAFANEIGVDTSVLNNIMSPYGRKGKPSFDTLQKIAAKFPRVNIDWLVTGKGEPLRPFTPIENGYNHNHQQLALHANGVSNGKENGQANYNFSHNGFSHNGHHSNPENQAERNQPSIAELQSLLKVCNAEKENLQRILMLKDELIEILRNQKL